MEAEPAEPAEKSPRIDLSSICTMGAPTFRNLTIARLDEDEADQNLFKKDDNKAEINAPQLKA